MHKLLLISGSILGLLVLALVGVLVYALVNLNSIIRDNRDYLLSRVAQAVGRPVEAGPITAVVGWGLSLQVNDLRVADDPSFSHKPFITVHQISSEVELLPLLGRRVFIRNLTIESPTLRLFRDQQGRLNAATLWAHRATIARALPHASPSPSQALSVVSSAPVPAKAPAQPPVIALMVKSLRIDSGNIIYQDAGFVGPAIRIRQLDLALRGLSATAPFFVSLTAAALSSQRNLTLSGRMGPLMRGGKLDAEDAPVKLALALGPILLDRIRTIPGIAGAVPNKLSMPDPFVVRAELNGSARALALTGSADLTAARVVYLGAFNKPAGTLLQLSADAFRRGESLGVQQATLKLADLRVRASALQFQHSAAPRFSATFESNRFELGSVSKMAAALVRYVLTGRAEAHLTVVQSAQGAVPQVAGTIAFAKVGFKHEGSKLPGITHLTGTLALDGNSAKLSPTSFDIGSDQATLEGSAASLHPLQARFRLSAARLELAQLMPNARPSDQVRGLIVDGTAAGSERELRLAAQVVSSGGAVADMPYRALGLEGTYQKHQLHLSKFKLDAFSGSIAGSASASLTPAAPFRSRLALIDIDLHQALLAAHAKAAENLRGRLSGRLELSGAGDTLQQVEPTLTGAGQATLSGGELVGVNVVGQALQKINRLPSLESLLTPAIIERHPALFHDPNTELQQARLSFAIAGQRVTSNDIVADAPDYSLRGAGWFDFDRKLDLKFHLLLSRELSGELRAQKKNVVYLMNDDQQIDVPMVISGALPRPLVQPDLAYLAQHLTQSAIAGKGGKLINRFLNKNKGIRQWLGL